jgi:hypothetical protein
MRPRLALLWRMVTCSHAILGVLLLLFFLWLVRDHDVQDALWSPETHRNVYSIPTQDPARVFEEATDSGDFDGDGIEDRLSTEYYHQEPLG